MDSTLEPVDRLQQANRLPWPGTFSVGKLRTAEPPNVDGDSVPVNPAIELSRKPAWPKHETLWEMFGAITLITSACGLSSTGSTMQNCLVVLHLLVTMPLLLVKHE